MKKTSAPTCRPGTAVAYARYSSAGQRDVSIEQQLADIRAYAKREGYTIVHEYADHAKSGFRHTSSRTAFQSMMVAADHGSFDTVICWKVDRFGRNREDAAVYKGQLRRRGVRVIYAMEPIPDGSAGVLLEGMLEATAEWYSRQLSENISRGMNDNARKCLCNGGKRTFGYIRGPDDHYTIQPDEAAVVRNVFELYRTGYSAATICKQLSAHGVVNASGRPFRPSVILHMVSNERYIGVYTWNDQHTEGGIPAIIDKSVYEEVQRMKQKTARHVEHGVIDYLLTGKAFCGYCGASMIGDSGTSRTGERHYYYTCQAHKARKKCNKKSVRKEYLEDTVIDFLLDRVLKDPEIEKIADAVIDAQEKELKTSPLSAMEEEHKTITKQIDNINNAIANGVWSSTTVTKLKSLEETAAELLTQIETMRYSQSQLLDRDRVKFFLGRFRKGDRQNPDFRRYLINTFVNAVYVFDDHIKLVINNCEGNLIFPIESIETDSETGSDCNLFAPPIATHPNPRVTVYRIAI